MNVVARCRVIAEKAHEGQTRAMGDDANKPYIVHSGRMAAKFHDETLAAIAWLHDVLEDTGVGPEELLADPDIPAVVVNSVVALTRREGETYLDYVLRVVGNPLAAQVKLADLEDNMATLEEGSRKDKYRMAAYIIRREQAAREAH